MALLAKAYADNIPEYRFEYEEIVTQCKELTTEFLDQCNDTKEVNDLLKHPSGEEKYFRYSDQMKYPLLRMAIEHSNKPFVGHMYCQQTLRQAWYGDTRWQRAPTLYKFFMFLIHVFPGGPLYAAQVLILQQF